jgi:HPt (histidine-containing phosphotransfer) domain-containing protein
MSPAFDRAHFDMMTGADRALQYELICMFREQAALWRLQLCPDAPAGVWGDAAHTVKGSARGLGLFALGDLCAEAEALAKAGAVEGFLVDAALERVQVALAQALQALDASQMCEAVA